MSSVRRILQIKGNDVWSVTPDSSVYDALRLMRQKDVGALIVIQGSELAGVFSERDYARKVVLEGKSSREIKVKEVMTKKVFSVHPEQTVQECMELMIEKHIRHLPVVIDQRVVGVISIGDVVQDIIYKQKESIKSLEQRLQAKAEG
jgi:CBS domain-containing protein